VLHIEYNQLRLVRNREDSIESEERKKHMMVDEVIFTILVRAVFLGAKNSSSDEDDNGSKNDCKHALKV